MGDEILAAGEAQRLHDEDPTKRVAIVGRNMLPRWHDLWEGNPIIAKPEECFQDEILHIVISGTNARPYNAAVPFTRESGVQFTNWRARDNRGRLYLRESELARGRQLRDEGPYWVVEPSPSRESNSNKRWPLDRFQDAVWESPELNWVQPIHRDSFRLSRVHSIETASFRDACGLLAGAAGYLGTEGGLHHAAAALGVPAVVIFGGCMSVETFGYPEHANLADTGPGSPCGRWVACDHCREAMRRIMVFDVLDGIKSVSGGPRVLESAPTCDGLPT